MAATTLYIAQIGSSQRYMKSVPCSEEVARQPQLGNQTVGDTVVGDAEIGDTVVGDAAISQIPVPLRRTQ